MPYSLIILFFISVYSLDEAMADVISYSEDTVISNLSVTQWDTHQIEYGVTVTLTGNIENRGIIKIYGTLINDGTLENLQQIEILSANKINDPENTGTLVNRQVIDNQRVIFVTNGFFHNTPGGLINNLIEDAVINIKNLGEFRNEGTLNIAQQTFSSGVIDNYPTGNINIKPGGSIEIQKGLPVGTYQDGTEIFEKSTLINRGKITNDGVIKNHGGQTTPKAGGVDYDKDNDAPIIKNEQNAIINHNRGNFIISDSGTFENKGEMNVGKANILFDWYSFIENKKEGTINLEKSLVENYGSIKNAGEINTSGDMITREHEVWKTQGNIENEKSGVIVVKPNGHLDNWWNTKFNNFGILLIESDGKLTNSGQLDNDARGGIIHNLGEIVNWEKIYSSGTIENDGTIENHDTLALMVGSPVDHAQNGMPLYHRPLLSNSGTIQNNASFETSLVADLSPNTDETSSVNGPHIKNQHGGIINNDDGSIFLRKGATLENSAEININGGYMTNQYFALIENKDGGRINNNGNNINNHGTIKNDGVIDNSGTITNSVYGEFSDEGGTIHNNRLIANSGTIDNKWNSQINNEGVIHNKKNQGDSIATLDNQGSISNLGTISTTGNLLNNKNIIFNPGTLSFVDNAVLKQNGLPISNTGTLSFCESSVEHWQDVPPDTSAPSYATVEMGPWGMTLVFDIVNDNDNEPEYPCTSDTPPPPPEPCITESGLQCPGNLRARATPAGG